MKTISFFVEGDPKGQPRARACIRGKHAGVYDPGTADAWKMAVAEAWRHKVAPENAPRLTPFDTAVSLRLAFCFRRPKSHYCSGKNSDILRDRAPRIHTAKPDLDNLAKAVMDVLTRLGAWTDDAIVCRLSVSRSWAIGLPGCQISIAEVE